MGKTDFRRLEAQIMEASSRSAQPNEHGFMFEAVVKWWLENSPVYSAMLQDVQLCPPGTVGIDLTARSRSGRLCGIQVKMQRAPVGLEDIGLMPWPEPKAANRPDKQFDHLMLVTTSPSLSSRAESGCLGKGISVVVRKDLLDSDVSWPALTRRDIELLGAIVADRPGHGASALDDLLRGKNKPTEPRRESPDDPRTRVQREAIGKIVRGFMEHPRGKLHMPPGAGKTLVALRVAEKLKAERILFMVPSIALVRQTMREWCRWRDRRTARFTPVAVCSSERVRDGLVDISPSYVGTPVTNDPETISRECATGRTVVFSTYSSSDAIADSGVKFDLIVADEAHHCAGALGRLFTAVLDDGRIMSERRLFMTATSKNFSGRVVEQAGRRGHQLASMDDEKQFGPVFYSLSFSRAIELGICCDYEVRVATNKDDRYREMIEDATLIRTDHWDTDAYSVAVCFSLLGIMSKIESRRMLAFLSCVTAGRRSLGSRRFAKLLNSVAKWLGDRTDARSIDSSMAGGMAARNDTMAWFEAADRPSILCNHRCCIEGVDFPDLDAAAFVDPKQSGIEIVQAIGRTIRRAAGKEKATIIIPLFMRPGDDANSVMEDSAFQTVRNVIRALSRVDERFAEGFAEEINAYRLRLGERTLRRPRLERVHFDLPENWDADKVRRFKESIGDEIVRLLDAPDYTEPQVVAAIVARMASEPDWKPLCNDVTQIPGLPPGSSCMILDAAIRRCGRGFTCKNDSLYRMLRRNGVPVGPTVLSEALICAKVKALMESKPDWNPTNNDTVQIPGLEMSCKQLDSVIKQCCRGLTVKGDSLLKMLRRNGIRPPAKSRFPGVHPCGAKWQAEARIGGRNLYLGCFDTVEDAVSARRTALAIRDAGGTKEEIEAARHVTKPSFPGVYQQGAKWYFKIKFAGSIHTLGGFDTGEGAQTAHRLAKAVRDAGGTCEEIMAAGNARARRDRLGVSWQKKASKWQAFVYLEFQGRRNRSIYLGLFDTKEDAVEMVRLAKSVRGAGGSYEEIKAARRRLRLQALRLPRLSERQVLEFAASELKAQCAVR